MSQVQQQVALLFTDAQKSAAVHKRCAAALARLLTADATGRKAGRGPAPAPAAQVDEVVAVFKDCLDRVLVSSRVEAVVTRLTGFVAKACAEGGAPLLVPVLQHLVERCSVKDKNVRLHAISAIHAVLGGLGGDADLPGEVWDGLTTALLARTKDKLVGIRALAARALHRLQNDDGVTEGSPAAGEGFEVCPVLTQLVFLLHHDPAKDVRAAAVHAVSVNASTLPAVVDHACRDASVEVRVACLRKLAAWVEMSLLAPGDRVALLATGLADSSADVRQAATLLAAGWLAQCEGDFAAFLQGLGAGVAPPEAAAAAGALGGHPAALDPALSTPLEVFAGGGADRVGEAVLTALFAFAEGPAPMAVRRKRGAAGGGKAASKGGAAAAAAAAAEEERGEEERGEGEDGGEGAGGEGEDARDVALAPSAPVSGTLGTPGALTPLQLWEATRTAIARTAPSVHAVDVETALFWRVRAAWLCGYAGLGAGVAGLTLRSPMPPALRGAALDALLPGSAAWAQLAATVAMDLGVCVDPVAIASAHLLAAPLAGAPRAFAVPAPPTAGSLLAAASRQVLRPGELPPNMASDPDVSAAMLRQWLLLGQCLDFADEAGRRAAVATLMALLPHPAFPGVLVPLAVNALAVALGAAADPWDAVGGPTAAGSSASGGVNGAVINEQSATLHGVRVLVNALASVIATLADAVMGPAAADDEGGGGDAQAGVLRAQAAQLQEALDAAHDADDVDEGAIASLKAQLASVEEALAAAGAGSSASGPSAFTPYVPVDESSPFVRVLSESDTKGLLWVRAVVLARSLLGGAGAVPVVATLRRHLGLATEDEEDEEGGGGRGGRGRGRGAGSASSASNASHAVLAVYAPLVLTELARAFKPRQGDASATGSHVVLRSLLLPSLNMPLPLLQEAAAGATSAYALLLAVSNPAARARAGDALLEALGALKAAGEARGAPPAVRAAAWNGWADALAALGPADVPAGHEPLPTLLDALQPDALLPDPGAPGGAVVAAALVSASARLLLGGVIKPVDAVPGAGASGSVPALLGRIHAACVMGVSLLAADDEALLAVTTAAAVAGMEPPLGSGLLTSFERSHVSALVAVASTFFPVYAGLTPVHKAAVVAGMVAGNRALAAAAGAIAAACVDAIEASTPVPFVTLSPAVTNHVTASASAAAAALARSGATARGGAEAGPASAAPAAAAAAADADADDADDGASVVSTTSMATSGLSSARAGAAGAAASARVAAVAASLASLGYSTAVQVVTAARPVGVYAPLAEGGAAEGTPPATAFEGLLPPWATVPLHASPDDATIHSALASALAVCLAIDMAADATTGAAPLLLAQVGQLNALVPHTAGAAGVAAAAAAAAAIKRSKGAAAEAAAAAAAAAAATPLTPLETAVQTALRGALAAAKNAIVLKVKPATTAAAYQKKVELLAARVLPGGLSGAAAPAPGDDWVKAAAAAATTAAKAYNAGLTAAQGRLEARKAAAAAAELTKAASLPTGVRQSARAAAKREAALREEDEEEDDDL